MATSQTQTIPIRRVLLTDDSQLPSHYSSTPGGTLYSTTPNGESFLFLSKPLTTDFSILHSLAQITALLLVLHLMLCISLWAKFNLK